LRGIPLQEQSLYKGTEFKCKDGSKILTINKLNDDYCDCNDGSDEPGTSACPNGKFYCENKGFKGLNISSSKVNDGICDCCDGSDEYNTSVKCFDSCRELGDKERKKKEIELESFRKGITLKAQYIQQGKQAKIDRENRLQELKRSVEQLEKKVNTLETIKKEKEDAEKIVLDKRAAAGKPPPAAEDDDEKRR